VFLSNNIIAGNDPSSPADYRQDVIGEIVSNGHNIFSQGDVIGAKLSDIIVAPEDVFTTVLGPLTDNGGPTLTHAPLPGSPAIDAGDTADAVDANDHPLRTDQRGFSRLVGDAVDIGSVEFGARRCHGSAFSEFVREHLRFAVDGDLRERLEELVTSWRDDHGASDAKLSETGISLGETGVSDWNLLG
jgi:hypothetical protein